MTEETILTDDAIHNLIVDFEIECDYGIETTPVDNIVPFSRAIEQDVLQSPEVKAWKRDAERYKWLKDQFRIMSLDMGGNHTWVLQRPLREGCSIDAVCDASMEKPNE